MALILYAHPLSLYSQKALAALYELALPFEFRHLEPAGGEHFDELRRLWPFGKFPVLLDDRTVVAETSLIVEHLDGRAGGDRLLPADPLARIEARLMDRVFDNYVASPTMKITGDLLRDPARRDRQGVEEAHALLEKSYAWLESRLAGRQWAAGNAFTVADCAGAPALFFADWFHPVGSHYPALSGYLQRVRRRPSVARAFDEARPFLPLVPGGIPPHVT